MEQISTLGSIRRLARSTTVRWLGGLLLAAASSVLGYAATWHASVATESDLKSLRAELLERLNEHDHLVKGDLPDLVDEHGNPKPPHPHPQIDARVAATEAAIKALKDDRTKAFERLATLESQISTLYRWQVRLSASMAEPRARHRAEAARQAAERFDRFLDRGLKPEDAARRAVETNPYHR